MRREGGNETSDASLVLKKKLIFCVPQYALLPFIRVNGYRATRLVNCTFNNQAKKKNDSKSRRTMN